MGDRNPPYNGIRGPTVPYVPDFECDDTIYAADSLPIEDGRLSSASCHARRDYWGYPLMWHDGANQFYSVGRNGLDESEGTNSAAGDPLQGDDTFGM